MSGLDLNHPASLPLNRARTIDEATPRERQRIWGLLDRCGLTIVDSPPEGMGVVYVTFLPWRPHGERWAYMGRSKAWNLTYLGTGKEGSFIGAKRKHPRGDFIKVCVAVAENGAPLIALEDALQKQAGIRRTREEPQHRDWLNVLAHGGGASKGAPLATREQCSAGGKIGGKIGGKATAERERTDPEFRASQQALRKAGGKIRGKIHGKKYGPAAAANMNRRLVDLRSTHDPAFLDEFQFPIVRRPEGWEQKWRDARSGPDIADNAIVVPLARPATHGNRRSESKTSQWIIGALRMGVCRFSDVVAMRDAMFPEDGVYTGPGNARRGLSRESAGGLFAICCPETGRVLRGYGQDEDRLTYRLGVGWLRGRVRSSGPLAYWRGP